MFRLVFITAVMLMIGHQAQAAVKWNNPSSGEDLEFGKAVGKKNKAFKLPKDIGFGLYYEQSLSNNFQKWGATVTNEQVRLGNKAIKFETREGFCGFDDGHSDCNTGRNRHEFSSKVKPSKKEFDLNKEYWHSLSLYIPSEPDFDSKIETGLFQLNGKPNVAWKFHFNDIRGFYVTSYTELWKGKTFQKPEKFLDKWNDIILQVVHSTEPTGILNVWINGEKVFEFTGITTMIEGFPYFKFGIYNTSKPIPNPKFNNGKNFKDLWVYFDEIRFSETCEGLKLSDLGYNCKKL